MSSTPAPHFLTARTDDPVERETVETLNEKLKAEIAEGGTDTAFYMRILKAAMIELASSESMQMLAIFDPMALAMLHSALITGGALERTLVNRELVPDSPGCGNPDCPNCGCEGGDGFDA
jgi:hypothetical protein